MDVKEVHIFSPHSVGICIAQYPAAGQEVVAKKVTLYFSQGKSLLSVMPDLKEKPLSDALDSLRLFDVRAEVFHTSPVDNDHTCQRCKIVDQQPVAGAMVDLSRSLRIQLQVSQA